MSTINYQYILGRIGEKTLKAVIRDVNGDINEDLIAEFIDEADAEVDSALSQRYTYPYVTIDEILGEKSLILIQRWKFSFVRKLIYALKYDDEEMKAVIIEAGQVSSRLKSILEGKTELPGLEKVVTAPKEMFKIQPTTQIFTKDKLESLG
jgi:hypothetical protein